MRERQRKIYQHNAKSFYLTVPDTMPEQPGTPVDQVKHDEIRKIEYQDPGPLFLHRS